MSQKVIFEFVLMQIGGSGSLLESSRIAFYLLQLTQNEEKASVGLNLAAINVSSAISVRINTWRTRKGNYPMRKGYFVTRWHLMGALTAIRLCLGAVPLIAATGSDGIAREQRPPVAVLFLNPPSYCLLVLGGLDWQDM